MEKLNVYAAKLVPKNENFAQGHRACQGCAEALALRQIGKALGKNVITASATGCMEVISSPFPFTSWNTPWIHVAFENAAAVATGAESGLKALMRKGRIPQRKIFVLALAGDGGTSDIGVQAGIGNRLEAVRPSVQPPWAPPGHTPPGSGLRRARSGWAAMSSPRRPTRQQSCKRGSGPPQTRSAPSHRSRSTEKPAP